MNAIKKITLCALLALTFTACGKSVKQKMQGKWRWESIQQKSGDVLPMMEDELYFSFKDGQYLYTDAKAKGNIENWNDAVPFEVDEKTSRMTVKTKSGNADSEHYRVSFKKGGYLFLTIDDMESNLYNDIWILKKVQ
jgi:hypothetical protein